VSVSVKQQVAVVTPGSKISAKRRAMSAARSRSPPPRDRQHSPPPRDRQHHEETLKESSRTGYRTAKAAVQDQDQDQDQDRSEKNGVGLGKEAGRRMTRLEADFHVVVVDLNEDGVITLTLFGGCFLRF